MNLDNLRGPVDLIKLALFECIKIVFEDNDEVNKLGSKQFEGAINLFASILIQVLD